MEAKDLKAGYYHVMLRNVAYYFVFKNIEYFTNTRGTNFKIMAYSYIDTEFKTIHTGRDYYLFNGNDLNDPKHNRDLRELTSHEERWYNDCLQKGKYTHLSDYIPKDLYPIC